MPMYSACNDLKGRVSPFGNLRINVCLLTPRSLSQATTSFIACNRQGIHHVHLFACPYNVSLWSDCSAKDVIEHLSFAFAVSKESIAFYVENSLHTLMIDTITTHQRAPIRSS